IAAERADEDDAGERLGSEAGLVERPAQHRRADLGVGGAGVREVAARAAAAPHRQDRPAPAHRPRFVHSSSIRSATFAIASPSVAIEWATILLAHSKFGASKSGSQTGDGSQ